MVTNMRISRMFSRSEARVTSCQQVFVAWTLLDQGITLCQTQCTCVSVFVVTHGGLCQLQFVIICLRGVTVISMVMNLGASIKADNYFAGWWSNNVLRTIFCYGVSSKKLLLANSDKPRDTHRNMENNITLSNLGTHTETWRVTLHWQT
jgi:hypothetical protein